MRKQRRKNFRRAREHRKALSGQGQKRKGIGYKKEKVWAIKVG